MRTVDLSLPVASVVVLEDRAQVTRAGRAAVSAGRSRLVVQGVAPVAVDKSVRASSTTEGATIVDVRIVRTPVFVSTDELDAEIRRLREVVEEHEGRMRRLHREAYDTDRLLVSFLDEVAEDAAWARAMTAEKRAAYEELVRRSRHLAEKAARHAADLEEEKLALARKIERRRATERPDGLVGARLEIDLEADVAGEADIDVSYVVPNACWRPRHRVTLSEAPPGVSVETEAVVWQNTGEDWAKVQLSLSTERASLGAAIPKLETDRLSTKKKGALVVQTREQQIEEAGLGGGGVAIRKTEEMPGIEDGGEALLLRAEVAADVPSDGRPHAVPIASFQSPADVELVVMAELAQAAITKTTFSSSSKRPLLAGPVDLVRRGGAAGRARVGFIAPGEKVAIGWGPEPTIRVFREVEPLKDETNLLGSWHTQTHDVRVRVVNLGSRPTVVTVKERVPVSEIDKVKIEVVAKETTDGAQPDESGILSWKLALGPYANKTVSLRVVTRRHADVVG